MSSTATTAGDASMSTHFGPHKFASPSTNNAPRPCHILGCDVVREGRRTDESTASTTTHNLRTQAARPAASNVDYWAFRSRSDAEAADRDVVAAADKAAR